MPGGKAMTAPPSTPDAYRRRREAYDKKFKERRNVFADEDEMTME